MSRIYGGIHFLFSDTAGLTAGGELGAYVLQTFSTTNDTTPPTITLTSPATGSVTSIVQHHDHRARVLDNLSGVASLQGAGRRRRLRAGLVRRQGNFSLTTTFATDGTADGTHTIDFQATDFAGNVTPLGQRHHDARHQGARRSRSPARWPATLTDGEYSSGTADGTGSAITALSYNFDGGTEIPVTFDSDGSFSTAARPLRLWPSGTHTLTVTAQDAAGNVTHDTVDLNLAAPPALTLSSVAPTAGATDVGVTFRPKIVFSRPIDTDDADRVRLLPDRFDRAT